MFLEKNLDSDKAVANSSIVSLLNAFIDSNGSSLVKMPDFTITLTALKIDTTSFSLQVSPNSESKLDTSNPSISSESITKSMISFI